MGQSLIATHALGALLAVRIPRGRKGPDHLSDRPWWGFVLGWLVTAAGRRRARGGRASRDARAHGAAWSPWSATGRKRWSGLGFR
jgi:hypothetical protein